MRRVLLAGLLGLMIASCAGGSETGNPAVTVSVELQVRSSNSGSVAVGKGADRTVIQEAWVAFGAWEFLPAGQCEALETRQSEPDSGALLADLAQKGDKTQLELDAADYCGVVATLEDTNSELPAGAPAELETHSIVVKGERADGTPFLLAYPEGEELILQSVAESFAIDAATTGLLFSFDVYMWMKDMDLDNARVSSDGDIQINGEQNRELLEAFENNLECSLELYEDSNGNGSGDSKDLLLASCADL